MHIMMCPVLRLRNIPCCPWCSMHKYKTKHTTDLGEMMDKNEFWECEEMEIFRMDEPVELSQAPRKSFTLKEAVEIGKLLGIDWSKSKFTPEEFRKGLDVELEHGRRNPQTNVTGDDPLLTGKIALAHLNEFPDYYERLSKVEAAM